MKISFWGSTNFSLTILQQLYAFHKGGKIELIYVVSQPAKPFGRKKELKNNPVAQFCIDNGITLLTPNKLSEIKDTLPQCDLAFVAAYGKILGEWVLQTATYGFLNFHGSILPKYRGAVPVQFTILNQDETGGISLIKMDKGMDTGDIITSIKYQVPRDTTGGELMVKLAGISAELLDKNFDLIFNPTSWQLQKQDGAQATFCYVGDFTKEKLEINYEDSVKLAHGKIMAANPDPKAWVIIDNKKYNLIRTFLSDADEETMYTAHGKLSFHTAPSSSKLYLELSDGMLQILEIQPEGKNVMDARSFINGYLK